MRYYNDPMISELHKFRAELWERSGHNMHKMIQIIEKEADEIMRKYGKIPPKRIQSTNVNLPTAKN